MAQSQGDTSTIWYRSSPGYNKFVPFGYKFYFQNEEWKWSKTNKKGDHLDRKSSVKIYVNCLETVK